MVANFTFFHLSWTRTCSFVWRLTQMETCTLVNSPVVWTKVFGETDRITSIPMEFCFTKRSEIRSRQYLHHTTILYQLQALDEASKDSFLWWQQCNKSRLKSGSILSIFSRMQTLSCPCHICDRSSDHGNANNSIKLMIIQRQLMYCLFIVHDFCDYPQNDKLSDSYWTSVMPHVFVKLSIYQFELFNSGCRRVPKLTSGIRVQQVFTSKKTKCNVHTASIVNCNQSKLICASN